MAPFDFGPRNRLSSRPRARYNMSGEIYFPLGICRHKLILYETINPHKRNPNHQTAGGGGSPAEAARVAEARRQAQRLPLFIYEYIYIYIYTYI